MLLNYVLSIDKDVNHVDFIDTWFLPFSLYFAGMKKRVDPVSLLLCISLLVLQIHSRNHHLSLLTLFFWYLGTILPRKSLATYLMMDVYKSSERLQSLPESGCRSVKSIQLNPGAWAPEFYFSQKIDYLKSEVQASFLKKHRGKKVSDTFKFSLWTISIQKN